MRLNILITPFVLAVGVILAGCGQSPTGVKTPNDPRIAEGTAILQTPHYEANPIVSPDGAWVLFESDRDGDLEIYLMPLGGGPILQVTDNEGFDSAPDWSPDASRVVFESDRTGRKHIHVLDRSAPGTPAVALTGGDGEDGSPSWSPLGLWVAFESNRDKTVGTDIYLVAADGVEVRRLTTTGEGVYCRSADWSPDGTRLIYESDESGQSALFTIPAAGGKETQITPDLGYEGHPAWSPRGDAIAFEASTAGLTQLFLVDPQGGPWTQVTFQGGNWPTWTPGGEALAYGAFNGTSYDIMIVGVD